VTDNGREHCDKVNEIGDLQLHASAKSTRGGEKKAGYPVSTCVLHYGDRFSGRGRNSQHASKGTVQAGRKNEGMR